MSGASSTQGVMDCGVDGAGDHVLQSEVEQTMELRIIREKTMRYYIQKVEHVLA
jgi:hypothetical protein